MRVWRSHRSDASLFPFGRRNHSQTASPALTPAAGSVVSASLGGTHIYPGRPFSCPCSPLPRNTALHHGCSVSPSQPPVVGGRTDKGRNPTVTDDAETKYRPDPTAETFGGSHHTHTAQLWDERTGVAKAPSNLPVSRVGASPGARDDDHPQERKLATLKKV